MTGLNRVLRRTVEGGRRGLVVIMEPAQHGHDAMITVREKGRRTGYTLTLPQLYVVLAQRAADHKRATRRGRKRGL